MVIVSCADDRYAMPLAVTLYSVLVNLDRFRTVSLYIIDAGISEQKKRRLTEVLNLKGLDVHLRWLKPDFSLLKGIDVTQWFSQAAYLRLLLPELLPEQFGRVIYLDSDLVVEEDLDKLWEEDVGDYPALAVQNYPDPLVSSPGALVETYQLLGLAPDTPYCNTGVMVINLNQWRAERIGSRVLDYTRKFQQFVRCGDQDGLNAIIAGAWGLLDPKWNVALPVISSYGLLHNMSRVEIQHAQEELLRAPFILHFCGPIKPWDFMYRGPARSRFFHYLCRSGWFSPLEGISSLIRQTLETQNEYDPWKKRLYMATQELNTLIPIADSLILVDEN
jgi:lipopolysaccharide biosynthesis glycosyltransferase